SAAEFFQLPIRPKPFGAGPWPCMNPVCEHYQKPSIEKYEIRHKLVGYQNKMAADFRCVCGFTYSRPIPDSTSVGTSEGYRVKSCGAIWDETLRQLYLSGNYTYKELTQKLGVTIHVIARKLLLLRRSQQVLDNHESADQARVKLREE